MNGKRMKLFLTVRISELLLVILIVLVLSGGAFTVSKILSSQHARAVTVSWDSKGIFTHYSNVSTSRDVTVELPLSLNVTGMQNYGGRLEQALREKIEKTLREEGFNPSFSSWGYIKIPTRGIDTSQASGSVVLIDVPFYGRENDECYADVLIYMNSNPDVKDYLSITNDTNNKLSEIARELFNSAKSKEKGSYSLEVVYWNNLRVKVDPKVNKACWDIMANVIAKEVGRWAKTLNKP